MWYTLVNTSSVSTVSYSYKNILVSIAFNYNQALLDLFLLPNASQSSTAPMSRSNETAMTATSVSTVRVMTQLSLSFTTSETCILIQVSASSREHGDKLETSPCGG